MAKVSFTKLGLSKNQEVKNVQWGDYVIEVNYVVYEVEVASISLDATSVTKRKLLQNTQKSSLLNRLAKNSKVGD